MLDEWHEWHDCHSSSQLLQSDSNPHRLPVALMLLLCIEY